MDDATKLGKKLLISIGGAGSGSIGAYLLFCVPMMGGGDFSFMVQIATPSFLVGAVTGIVASTCKLRPLEFATFAFVAAGAVALILILVIIDQQMRT